MDSDDLSDLIMKPTLPHRKPAKGKEREDYIVKAMYAMYLNGPDNRPCTLKEVARAYKITYQTLQGLFRRRGYQCRHSGYKTYRWKQKREIVVATIKEVRTVELLPSPDAIRLQILREGGLEADKSLNVVGEGATFDTINK